LFQRDVNFQKESKAYASRDESTQSIAAVGIEAEAAELLGDFLGIEVSKIVAQK